MEKFLLKVINQDGEEIWNDLVRLKWTHLDSFKEFSKKNNVTIPLSSDQKAALALASINYTSILKHKFGYVFYLPETCSEKQIEYLDNNLEFSSGIKALRINLEYSFRAGIFCKLGLILESLPVRVNV